MPPQRQSIAKSQADIIALTETKLRENELYQYINIDGYKFIHKDSPTLAGGVGLYIKNSISFYCLLKYKHTVDLHFIENLWIKIENKNKKIYVGVVYRQLVSFPERIELFSNGITIIFHALNNKKSESYILRDLKINLLQLKFNSQI